MKKPLITLFMATALIATSCSEDDISDPLNPVGDSKVYELNSVAESDIGGTATFIRNEDNSTTIEVELVGASPEESYPVHIKTNTAIETGDIAITLNPIDGETGISTTTLSKTNDSTAVTFTDLMEFDGHLTVRLSENDPSLLVAQVDIGQNELTGEAKTYELNEADVAGVTGTATFEKRKNGETLATLTASPTNAGEMHPAHIHINTAVETGSIAFTFDPIDGATGKSVMNLTTLDDGTAINFEDLSNFDGYVDVHLGADNLETIIGKTDIGQNELTGESATYALDAVTNPNISGNAIFSERLNGETLITLNLEGTVDGDTHPVHIYAGPVADASGTIAITLNNVNGETGTSRTNIKEFDDGGAVNYDGLMNYDGHIDVHLSPIDLDTLIAQGDMGTNVE